MIETVNTAKPEAQAPATNDITLIDFAIALAKRKKALVVGPLLVAAVAAAASFALPNVYQATTRLLPPQQSQSGAAALLAQLGGVASIAAGASGLKSPNDLYVGMLKSRTIADNLVAKFDLKKAYDVDSNEKARKILDENTVIVAGKDGLITIDVSDEDQKRVAPLANAYVEQLLGLTSVLAVTEAAQRRLFYQQQLEATKNNLANVEAKLNGGLETRGVVSVDAESRAIIETVGRLRARVSAKEIELNAMQAFVTSSNPDYRRVQEELSSLRGELRRLQNGRGDQAAGVDRPDGSKVGLENIKLLRDVKYYEMLYELLAKQYELARLDEAKDASIVQVLDKAIAPERKAKPKRAIIVVLAAIVAFLGIVFWIVMDEIKQRALRSPASAAQYEELKSYLWRSRSNRSK